MFIRNSMLRTALLVAAVLAAKAEFTRQAAAKELPFDKTEGPTGVRGVDRFGDPLPPGALARFGTLRLVQGGRAYGMALSPDGKLLATGDEHGMLRLWDTSSGKERGAFDCEETLGAVVFVPDPAGWRLAARTNTGQLRVWELESRKLVLQAKHAAETTGFGGIATGMFGLASSADGRLLAVGADNMIHLWDLSDGKELRHWAAHRGGSISLSFTPDGKGLLSGGRNYEPITGGRLLVRPQRSDDGYALALWDPATGKLEKKFTEQAVESHVLGFTADGRSWGSIGSGKGGFEFRLWDRELRTGAVVSLDDIKRSISGAAMSPDGKTLAVYSQTIGLWDVATGKRLSSLKHEDDYYTFALAFLPDGQTLAAGPGSARVRFWDLATGKPRHVFNAHEHAIWAVAISPDGKTAVTGGQYGAVREWEVASGKPLRDFSHEKPTAKLADLRYAPDGKSLTCAFFGTVRRWDTAKGEQLSTIAALPNSFRFTAMQISPDGKKLVYQAFDDDVLHLWDLGARKDIRQFPLGKGGADSLAYSQWDELIATSVKDQLTLWDGATGAEIYRRNHSRCYESTFSPDGLLLGLFTEPTRILEAGSGMELMKIPHRVNHGVPRALAFSPDGRYLAITELENIGIWDVLAGKFVHTFRGHRKGTNSVAFTPDGKRLISGSYDTTALVWDMSVVPEEKLRALNWAALWDKLKDADRREAYTASWHLRRAPEKTVALLGEHLRPVAALDAARIEQALNDLDSPVFDVREKAMEKLLRHGDADNVAKRLHEYAKEPLGLEVQRRLERVMPQVGGTLETRRLLWSLRLLEMFGTDDARALLRRMADGDPASPVTRQARLALNKSKLATESNGRRGP